MSDKDKDNNALSKITKILTSRLQTAYNMMISRDRLQNTDQEYTNDTNINKGKFKADSNALEAILSDLKFSYNDVQSNTASNRKLLAQKIMTVDLMNKELENAQDMLDTYKKSQNAKYRTIETNTYYQKAFSNKIYTTLYFIIFCVCLIVLVLLNKRNILKEPYYKFVMIPFIMIGSVFLLYNIIQLYLHDNMVYDQQNFILAGGVPTGESIWDYNKKHFFGEIKKGIAADIPNKCVGGTCCDKGTIWNNYVQRCVKDTDSIEAKRQN
tara:strand:+ start:159 stop:962 length:804 start_codon:yes stop_codon:yes gene_type:complete